MNGLFPIFLLYQFLFVFPTGSEITIALKNLFTFKSNTKYKLVVLYPPNI